MKTSPSDDSQTTFEHEDDYRELLVIVRDLSEIVASLSWGKHPHHTTSHQLYGRACDIVNRHSGTDFEPSEGG